MTNKFLIVEDEELAADLLLNNILAIRPAYVPVGTAQSVKDAISMIEQRQPDVIFMDIELTDGNCFDIFKVCEVRAPVIFMTAYNDYASQAFRVNSIDYLLKPADSESLTRAIERLESYVGRERRGTDYSEIEKMLAETQKKTRLLVSVGNVYTHIDVSDIAYFSAEDRYTVIHTFSGESHLSDFTLSQLEARLPAKSFFRLSRTYIANIKAIGKVHKHFNWRLKVVLAATPPAEVVVTAARRNDFLKWLGDE